MSVSQRWCLQVCTRYVIILVKSDLAAGYVFPSAASILPHLEEPKTGPTSLFCAELSKRLHCYVTAGYPERLSSDETRAPTSAVDDNGDPVDAVGANAAVLYGPDGNFVGNYRKTNPFETDMTWAKPGLLSYQCHDYELSVQANTHAGTGFASFDLPHPLHTVALGICMDLNAQPPAMWTLEDGPYELADHCIQKKANVLILLNAWLDSGEELEDPRDWRTLNFWAARLRPLWTRTEELEDEGSDSESEEETGKAEGFQREGAHATYLYTRIIRSS